MFYQFLTLGRTLNNMIMKISEIETIYHHQLTHGNPFNLMH